MYLDRIVAVKRKEIEQLKATADRNRLEREIAGMPPCRGFERALAAGKKRSMGLIAEIKKASPSKGLIRPDFDPAAIAKAYEAADADCLSVLTDKEFFQGSNEYLAAARGAVSLPVLRKDFILDPLQILEARQIGADAVLLIVAILNPAQLREYMRLAGDYGLDALVEVHDEKELDTALEAGASLIGINNRDLRTFATDLKTTEKLIAAIPKGVTVVSESGISGPEDIRYLASVGAHAVLVGEHFMRQADVGQAVRNLMDGVRPEGGLACRSS